MIDFIITIVLSGFWCIGIYAIAKNFVEEILDVEFEHWWFRLKRAEKIALKPLFFCPYCMASVHGTSIFFALLIGNYPIIMWIPFIVILCGFNYFLTQFFTE